MGPFIQALSLDESVWFDHFFIPNVCPIFYIETLADLAKTFKNGKNATREVQKIASRFPQCSSAPCAGHTDMCISDLLGHGIPMTGQIPVPHGRPVRSEQQTGVVYSESPEAKAFNRWYSSKFEEIERQFASVWRASLENLDLDAVGAAFRALGVSGKTCRMLEDAKKIANNLVNSNDRPVDKMKLAILFFNIPVNFQRPIFERWHVLNYPPLTRFAPYASFVLSVEVFFQVALAANLISADRPSNRTDIAYLFYLPFCMVFVSSDKLHRKCAPLFLRADQEFIWGEDLKRDLRQINDHFETLPVEEKEKGIIKFARNPPDNDEFLITQLWDRHLPNWRSRMDSSSCEQRIEDKELIAQLHKMKNSPSVQFESAPPPCDEDFAILERRVSKRKGSWWQLPADLEVPDEDEPLT